MKTYEFTLKHDNGTVKIRTSADNLEAAKLIIIKSEGCPERAITAWRIIPTAKQIRKTKNLLRGI